MASFVTATVWGQGRAAIKLAGTLKEGEEECQICRNDVPATVSFKPCAHNVCFACVENMRAKNIFKADKGVRCPFCRSFVDGYICVGRADAAVQKFLLEANKAASIAAAARRSAESGASSQQQQPLQYQPQQQQAQRHQPQEQAATRQGTTPQPVGAFSTETADMTWECHACNHSNYLWCTICGRCGKQIPPTLEHRLRNDHGKKDLLHVTKDELLELIVEKNHIGLNRAFFDVGMTSNYNKLSGSNASIVEAVVNSGAKRLMRVVELLASDPAGLRECSLHAYGNFGIQRLLECTARLREALTAAGRTSTLAGFARAHDGKDPFAAMLAAMLPTAHTYLHNEKGAYVVQCVAANASNAELIALANAVFPECVAVSKDPKGIFALIVLLEHLRDRCLSDRRTVEEAVAVTDSLCERFATGGSALGHTAGHALSGHMLVVALQVAMPRHNALNMASKIASGARQLAQVPGGQQTLVELLQLHGHDHHTAVALRDVAAGIAFSLQGTIGKLALGRAVQTNYGAPSPQELLQALIERLADEQEVGWLDSIINELVGVCDQLVDRPDGIELLEVALSLNVLDLDLISAHVSQMMSLLGEAKLKPVLDEVMDLVAGRLPPPAPKYTSLSVMQPELAYHLSQGHMLPAPPPPPPRVPPGAAAGPSPAANQQAPPSAARLARQQQQQQQHPPTQQQQRQQPSPQPAASMQAATAPDEEVWPSADAAGDWGQPSLQEQAPAASGWGEPGLPSRAGDAAPSPSTASVHPPAAPAHQQQSFNSQQPQQEMHTMPFGQLQQHMQQAVSAPQLQQPHQQPKCGQPFTAPFSMPVPVPIPVPVPQRVQGPAALPRPPAPAASAAAPSSGPPHAPPPAAPTAQLLFPPHMQVPVPVPVPIPAPAVAPRPQPQAPAASQARTLLPPFMSIPIPQPVVAAPASVPPAPRQPPYAAANAVQALPAPQQQQQWRQAPPPHAPSRAATPPAGGGGADAPAMRAPTGPQWACSVCTYVHTGAEAQFLMCALCGSKRGS